MLSRHGKAVAALVSAADVDRLPAVSVLPFDGAVARVYGEIGAALESAGKPLADADLRIAATALHHGLHLVTGNLKRFRRVPGLLIETVLAGNREARS